MRTKAESRKGLLEFAASKFAPLCFTLTPESLTDFLAKLRHARKTLS